MEVSVLKVRVRDEVRVTERVSLHRVQKRRRERPVRSPFFQPEVRMRFEDGLTHATAHPRGPTILIDMDMLGASLFE